MGRNKDKGRILILNIKLFLASNYKIKLHIDIKMENLPPLSPMTPAE